MKTKNMNTTQFGMVVKVAKTVPATLATGFLVTCISGILVHHVHPICQKISIHMITLRTIIPYNSVNKNFCNKRAGQRNFTWFS